MIFKSRKLLHSMIAACLALILLSFILSIVVQTGEDKKGGAEKANNVIQSILMPYILITAIVAYVARR